MDAEMQNDRASVLFGGSVNPPRLGTLAVSNAAPVGRRSFSLFFQTVLSRLRKLVHLAPVTPGCMLCAAKYSDAARLARLVAILPVGQKITVRALSAILNVKFRIISSDLHILVHQLRLPMKRTRRCILLKEPLHLCPNCARLCLNVQALRYGENQQNHQPQ
jgi:hypothetical protein